VDSPPVPPPPPAPPPPPPRRPRRARFGRRRAAVATLVIAGYTLALVVAIGDELCDFGLFPDQYQQMARGFIARFDSADPEDRRQAIEQFDAKIDDFLAVPELIRALDSPSLRIRATSIDLLRRITGVTQAYDPKAPQPERRRAIARWRSWFTNHNTRF
jgi:hypothetical protein